MNPESKAEHEVAVKIRGAEGVPTLLIALQSSGPFFGDSFVVTSFSFFLFLFGKRSLALQTLNYLENLIKS